MKTVTNLMGDFTKALINADSIGFDAISKEYDLVADRTFHKEVAPEATPSLSM